MPWSCQLAASPSPALHLAANSLLRQVLSTGPLPRSGLANKAVNKSSSRDGPSCLARDRGAQAFASKQGAQASICRMQTCWRYALAERRAAGTQAIFPSVLHCSSLLSTLRYCYIPCPAPASQVNRALAYHKVSCRLLIFRCEFARAHSCGDPRKQGGRGGEGRDALKGLS